MQLHKKLGLAYKECLEFFNADILSYQFQKSTKYQKIAINNYIKLSIIKIYTRSL